MIWGSHLSKSSLYKLPIATAPWRRQVLNVASCSASDITFEVVEGLRKDCSGVPSSDFKNISGGPASTLLIKITFLPAKNPCFQI